MDAQITMHRAEIPLEREPVILFTELKAPAIVFLMREEAPYMMPRPPSRGPLTKPSAGFVIRSCIPVEMFLKSPTGFPMILREPKTLRNSVMAYSLKWEFSLLVIPGIDSKQFVSFMPLILIDASISVRTTPRAVKTDFSTLRSDSFVLTFALKVRATSMLDNIS